MSAIGIRPAHPQSPRFRYDDAFHAAPAPLVRDGQEAENSQAPRLLLASGGLA
jgi:hypothetical protein